MTWNKLINKVKLLDELIGGARFDSHFSHFFTSQASFTNIVILARCVCAFKCVCVALVSCRCHCWCYCCGCCCCRCRHRRKVAFTMLLQNWKRTHLFIIRFHFLAFVDFIAQQRDEFSSVLFYCVFRIFYDLPII